MTKFRDIIKNTYLKNRIEVLTEDAKKDLRALGKNDFYHSDSIERNLDVLVPDEIKNNEKIFSEAEIFFLLNGVYLHDIGRKSDDEHHEKESYNKILENPNKYGLKNSYEGRAVAEICYGHAKEPERPIKQITTNYRIEEFGDLNLQFLAALLRLADEIDNAYKRVQGVKGQDESVRHSIRSVNINHRKWSIEIQCDKVSMIEKEKLQKIRDSAQKRLDEVKDILKAKGLLYDIIGLNIENIIKDKIELEKDIGIILENNEVPYVKTKAIDSGCILFGDPFGFSRKIYYFYSNKIVTIEELENILEIYDESLREEFHFNYPSFLINQTCNKNNIHYSWFGYGYENFIRALKERDARYLDTNIVDPHHSESAGFAVYAQSHIFYVAVLSELHRDNWFEVDVGFVFEKLLFDNKKYMEFYKEINFNVPYDINEEEREFFEPINLRDLDIDLKIEGFLRYKSGKGYWISKMIWSNPFYGDKTINKNISQHEKIVVNLKSHHPFNIDKQYRLYDARVVQIPYGVFEFNILNAQGDWLD